MGYKEGDGMNIEEGLLMGRKINYMGLSKKEAARKLCIVPSLLEMYLKGQVMSYGMNEKIKELMIELFLKKFGKKKKK